MIERSLIVALGVSVLAHTALLSTADWPWGDAPLSPTEQVMHATLRPLTVPVEISVAKPIPASVPQPLAQMPSRPKPAKQKPAPMAAVAPVEPVLSDAVPDVLPPAEEPAPIPAELAQAVSSPAVPAEAFDIDGWPAQGEIVFRVLLGSGGLQVGEARHDWSHDGKRYRMRLTLETTGVAALLRGFHYVQNSEGELGPQGLKPQYFSVAQQRKELETAVFDWDNARVSIRRGERERRTSTLQPGDQDVLSLWHQIGIVGSAGLPRTLTVVSNKDAKLALLEAVGTEGLRLPIGQLDTLRLRAQAEDGKLTIDIWLARNYGMLPVRIRLVDDKGEVLDHQAIQLRLSPPGEVPGKTTEKSEIIELKEEVPAFPLADLHIN